MHDSIEALRRAVVLLVENSEAERLFDSLTTVIRLARLHPVRLAYEAEDLNPLVTLERNDSKAFDRVVALIEIKRARTGVAPLVHNLDEKFDKVEYQRVFMDQKRQRQRRAADLENSQRPARDRLIGRARLDYMDQTAAKGKAELDALLERARQSTGSRLSRGQLDALRAQFWASVDKRLDELEQQIRSRRLRL